jgi:hypothetical protein
LESGALAAEDGAAGRDHPASPSKDDPTGAGQADVALIRSGCHYPSSSGARQKNVMNREHEKTRRGFPPGHTS